MIEPDFRLVLDTLADAVVAADAEGRIVYVNRSAERLLGWLEGELVGEALTTIIPERLHSTHHDGFRRYLATRVPQLIGRAVRVPARRRDGSEVEIELTLAVFGGAELLFVASLRDQSDRVELERQIAVTRYLRAATAAAGKLASHLDLDAVLQTVVQTLVDDFDAALARIWLTDETEGALLLRASGGLSTRTTTSPRARIELADYPYKIAAVVRTRRPFVQNGLQHDPHFEQEWVEREGIAAVAAFPLLIGGRVQGVMIYFSRRELPEEVVEVLATFAAIVTTTLHDVQLFVREQAARREAEVAARARADALRALQASEEAQRFLAEASGLLAVSLDYQTTLDQVARLAVPRLADWCVVYLVEAEGGIRLLAAAHVDPAKVALAWEVDRRYPVDERGEGAVATVIRTGRPLLLNEITEEMTTASTRDAEHARIIRDLGFRGGDAGAAGGARAGARRGRLRVG